MAKILLVEDDLAISDSTADWLSAANYEIEQAFDGHEAEDRLRLYEYDLIIMDWDLPGKPGSAVTRAFRESGGSTPVLFLTGKKDLENKLAGFDSGADDYLTKPFELPELKARIEALLKRPKLLLPKIIKHRHLEVDVSAGQVKSNGVEIKLLPKELALLVFFLKNKGHVFDHNALLNKVWSAESDASSEAVMTCVKRLRKKIDLEGEPSVITTVHGLGYRMD